MQPDDRYFININLRNSKGMYIFNSEIALGSFKNDADAIKLMIEMVNQWRQTLQDAGLGK